MFEGLSPQARAWLLIIAIIIAGGCTSAGLAAAGGATLGWAIAAGAGAGFGQLVTALMKSPTDPSHKDNPPGNNGLGIILLTAGLLACALFSNGCKTPKLEAGGAYATTNTLGQVSQDLNLALADASYQFSYETVARVFEFERNNRDELWKLTPKIKRELDRLRPKVVEVDRRWALARQAYRINPTAGNLTTVRGILAEIQRLVPVVESQLTPLNATLTTPN